MLVLTRKKHESVVIGNDVSVTVIDIREDRVRLGIVAPKHVPVHRQEVHDAIHGRESFADSALAPVEEAVSEMIIVEAKLEPGGKIRFTSEGGFVVQ
jgi:carbon storage regulator